jgi:acetyl esterase/lipase
MWGLEGRGRRAALACVLVVTTGLGACERVADDEPYVDPPDAGPEESNRELDVYIPAPEYRGPGMPVILYVHGGAFTGGCEQAPGHWRYDPAVEAGGVTVTECLAETPTSRLWSPLDYVDRTVGGENRGAVVVSVRYRLASGDGLPGGTHVLHEDQVADIDRAIRWIRGGGISTVTDDVDVDVDRLVVWGWSAGANLAAQQALGLVGDPTDPELPNRLILFAGVYDFDDGTTQKHVQTVVDPFVGRAGTSTYEYLFDCEPIGDPTDPPDPDPDYPDAACRQSVEDASLIHPSKAEAIADFPPAWIAHGAGDALMPDVESGKLVWVLAATQHMYSYSNPGGVDHDVVDPATQELPGCVDAQVIEAVFDWSTGPTQHPC